MYGGLLRRGPGRGWLVGVLVALTVSLAGAATASASRVYLAIGDSVGAGFGSTAGQSYFDLYCAYLKSPAGGSLVDQCVNESTVGLTSQWALDGGAIQNAVNEIKGSTDTPVVTVVLGGNDSLGSACEPITATGCDFVENMRTILNDLEMALATHPGPHYIQWLEYYNPDHNNPFGDASLDHATAAQLLGSDLAFTDCTSTDLALIGLDDAINCIAKQKGATPVDAYTPFQTNCPAGDRFSDALHPDDKGYGLIFDAFRDTPGTPVPVTPPPNGTWPFSGPVTPTPATPATPAPRSCPPVLSAINASRRIFAPRSRRHRRGTVFSFKLSAPARVTIAIERLAAGRLVRQRCRRPSARLRHDPRCTRAIPITRLVTAGRTGTNTIAFSGRVRGRALGSGRYKAVFTLANGAHRSGSQTLRFRVVDET
jgi:lysophospholipase L1-like esterase